MRTTAFRISIFFISIFFLLSGCNSEKGKRPPDNVTVQLKWIHRAQFAGFYAAEKKGFYSEENINVTLKPGGPDISPDAMISDLVRGETDFAVVGGDFFLQARSMGKQVVAIAVIFQRNPRVYVTMKDSGIVRPQDFVGKKLMVPPDALVQHNALIRKLGIDKSSIMIVPFERKTKPLTTGLIDAHMMYRTGLALAFEEEGYDTNFIWIENYGIRLYGDTIITTEKMIKEDPDLVERFLRATLEGWRYAIENPEEAVDMTVKYNVKLSKFRQLRMMQIQAPLIHTGKEEIGWMNRDVWVIMEDILLGENTIEIDEAFTMRFLSEIYSDKE